MSPNPVNHYPEGVKKVSPSESVSLPNTLKKKRRRRRRRRERERRPKREKEKRPDRPIGRACGRDSHLSSSLSLSPSPAFSRIVLRIERERKRERKDHRTRPRGRCAHVGDISLRWAPQTQIPKLEHLLRPRRRDLSLDCSIASGVLCTAIPTPRFTKKGNI